MFYGDEKVSAADLSVLGGSAHYPDLQKDRAYVLGVVSRNGDELQFAVAELQGRRDIVLAAVSQKGRQRSPYKMRLSHHKCATPCCTLLPFYSNWSRTSQTRVDPQRSMIRTQAHFESKQEADGSALPVWLVQTVRIALRWIEEHGNTTCCIEMIV
eukprot:3971463-Amphidinium_carterae.1